jgi:hypothetical protein
MRRRCEKFIAPVSGVERVEYSQLMSAAMASPKLYSPHFCPDRSQRNAQ